VANPLVPQLLPAVSFPGRGPEGDLPQLLARVGLTYSLSDDGKTLTRANYAMYFGQVGTAGVSGQVNPVTRVSVRYPWIDLNSDKFVQANEIQLGANGGRTPLAVTGNWDPNNPANPGTANTVDPNYKNDRTDEFIVGIDREIGAASRPASTTSGGGTPTTRSSTPSGWSRPTSWRCRSRPPRARAPRPRTPGARP
jgi:hypothetical protein